MAWYDGPITQSCSNQYYCDGSVEGGLEGGVDIGVVPGTAITSVSNGKVVGAGFHLPGNFVVTVRGVVDFFGQEMDLYYQHMRDKTVKVGDTVKIGDVVGHAGALTIIEFGTNPGNWPGNGGGWGGVWGPLPHPGRAINPVKSGFLASIKSGKEPVKPSTPPDKTAPASDTPSLSTGLGAGLSVGLLALLALAIVGIAVYFIFTA